MRRLVAAVVLLAVAPLAGCRPTAAGPAAPSATVARAERVDPALALPGRQVGWALPAGVRVRSGYGVRAGARYAVFGVGPGDPRGGDAAPQEGVRPRFGVLDLTDGTLAVRDGADPGRVSDAAAPVDAADGTAWAVRLEDGPRPAAECPDSPDYCWGWSLFATRLADGVSTRIADAARPGPQFFLPVPATDGATVAWVDRSRSTDGAGDLVVWRPGDRAPRRLATGLPAGVLSVDGGAAWVGGTGPAAGTLTRVDLGTGAVTTLRLPGRGDHAVVAGGSVAYLRRPATDAGSVQVVSARVGDAAGPGRVLMEAPDVYTLTWGVGGTLVTSTARGYGVLEPSGRRRGLPLDLLSGVHHDAGRVTLVAVRDGRQVVVVAGAVTG